MHSQPTPLFGPRSSKIWTTRYQPLPTASPRLAFKSPQPPLDHTPAPLDGMGATQALLG